MLELVDIGVWLEGRDDPVLDRVSLTVAAGEWVTVCGPSGSGKSTLARVAAGLVQATSGAVRAAACGFVAQDPAAQVLADTVAGDVAFPLESLALEPATIGPRVAAALAPFGLTARAWSSARAMSGGQQQLVSLAAAQAPAAPLLVLDEPTSQLDHDTAARLVAVLDAARRAGCAVLVTSHRADALAPADRVVVLQGGRVAYTATPGELWAQPDLCARLAVPAGEVVELAWALRDAGVPVDPAADLDALAAQLGARA